VAVSAEEPVGLGHDFLKVSAICRQARGVGTFYFAVFPLRARGSRPLESIVATRTELHNPVPIPEPTQPDVSARIQQPADGVPRQLVLPLDEFSLQTHGIPRPRRIFTNRNLKMSGISWVGFDMDYTLAIYDQPAMDRLSIDATVDKLVLRGYPDFIKGIPQATDFPVRGILIDKRFGHVLKMDRYKHVTKGYHGFRRLPKDELHALYHSKKIRPATPRYHWIDTLYALSEAALYAAMVDGLEKKGYAVDYAKTFTDIRESIDEAHRDGTILNAVMGDLPRYVIRDPNLAPTLHKFRSAGKKLFLLTNSRWPYTDVMMNYLLGGAMSEYPSWKNFFDVVICAATKPAFFQERRPLLERDGAELKPATFPLERGKAYEGGNLVDLERALGVTGGDQILYVGDHIYGDILRSKKESAWRTAMIMQELETEVLAYESCKDDFVRMETLEEARERYEDELRFYQLRFKELSRIIDGGRSSLNYGPQAGTPGGASMAELEADRGRVKRAVERIRGGLRLVDAELGTLEKRADDRFHPYWGSLLKEANEQSSFGAQVEEYA
jgi:HAD superfamily 5'-nucleotidase-like hydrolase